MKLFPQIVIYHLAFNIWHLVIKHTKYNDNSPNIKYEYSVRGGDAYREFGRYQPESDQNSFFHTRDHMRGYEKDGIIT